MASKSLGTLTLDLVAKVGGFEAGMGKAERSSEKWRKQVEKSAKAAGAAIGAGAAVAISAMAVWATKSIEAAAEVDKLARLAGTSTTEFQRYAAGARTVGIEQDKLSDILKDVNDKVGDFLVTGGGPLADFFEKVAPKVGVTAEQFRNLSGPQALGLYVDTLEKAGANQQEMTFFMEAIANDATALIPLLRNSGSSMKALGDQAHNLGLVLSEDAIQAAAQFQTDLDLMGRVASNVGQQVAGELLPHLSKLTEILQDPATAEAAKAMATGVGAALVYIVEHTVDAINWLRRLKGEIDENNIALLQDEIERIQGMMDGGILDRTILFGRDGVIEYYDDAELAAELAKLQAAVEAAKEKIAQDPLVYTPPGALTSGPGLNLPSKNEMEGSKEALKEYSDLYKSVTQVIESSWSDQSRALADYQQQIETLRAGMYAGIISEEQLETETALLEVALDDRLDKIREAQEKQELENAGFWERYLAAAEENLSNLDKLAESMLENFSGRFGDAFEDVITSSASVGEAFEGLADAMVRSVINATGQMLAQWAVYQAAQLLMNSSTDAASVASASVTGAGIAAAYAPAAAAASLATAGGNSVPAIAGMSAASAFALGPLLGMAHEGIDSIPQTGTWLLEKGERVTTAETSAKLDRTLSEIQRGGANNPIQVINNGPPMNARQEMDGDQIKLILDMADQRAAESMARGKLGKAAQSAFGLKRASR